MTSPRQPGLLARLLGPFSANAKGSVARAIALRAIRRAAPALGDPTVELQLGDMVLRLPMSHALPAIRAAHPYYSEVLGALAKAIVDVTPTATMVDIGANVGDSVAIVRSWTHLPILCVEASGPFFEFLRHNTASLRDLELENVFVGASNRQAQVSLHHHRGSAHVIPGGGGSVPSVSLTAILDRHPAIRNELRLLKVDTDGMDGLILRSGLDVLRERQPVLLFEYDPDLWARQGDDARQIFSVLSDAGYDSLMFYDNYGRYLLSTHCTEDSLLDDLNAHVSGRGGRNYFDVIAFARRDTGLQEAFRRTELARFDQRTSGPQG